MSKPTSLQDQDASVMSKDVSLRDARWVRQMANKIPEAIVCLLAHQPTGGYWKSERYIRYLLSLYPISSFTEERRTLILKNSTLLAVFADAMEDRLFRAAHLVNYLDPADQIVTVNDHELLWQLDMKHPVLANIEGEIPWQETIPRVEFVTR